MNVNENEIDKDGLRKGKGGGMQEKKRGLYIIFSEQGTPLRCAFCPYRERLLRFAGYSQWRNRLKRHWFETCQVVDQNAPRTKPIALLVRARNNVLRAFEGQARGIRDG